jgi:hypothetical protein
VITLTLNNGVTMPALGSGVFQSDPEVTAQAVDRAERPPRRERARGSGMAGSTVLL